MMLEDGEDFGCAPITAVRRAAGSATPEVIAPNLRPQGFERGRVIPTKADRVRAVLLSAAHRKPPEATAEPRAPEV